MAFQLVYYSQEDPKWQQDILGFGSPGDSIGAYGCALSCVAMMLSGHGFAETPKTLNQKLKNAKGFIGDFIVWGAISQIYPQVILKSFITCHIADTPLGLINASIEAGQPVIVEINNFHWVLLYAKEGNDYLMLDPIPYQTDVSKKTYLTPRYSRGVSLKQTITHVVMYEAFNADGKIAAGSSSPSTLPAKPASKSAYAACVKADAGLNIRSSIDISTRQNIVACVPKGTMLSVLGAEDYAKIGGINQWVRVRDEQGNEGFASALYLEKVSTPQIESTPTLTPAPTPEPEPVVAPAKVTPPPAPQEEQKLLVLVKSTGANIYKTASKKSEVVSKEKSGARLVVIESADKAASKIGAAGTWLLVKGTNGKRGYLDGGAVKRKS